MFSNGRGAGVIFQCGWTEVDHLSLCLYTLSQTLSLQNLIEPFNLLNLTDFRVVFRKWFLANSPFQLTDFRVVFRK